MNVLTETPAVTAWKDCLEFVKPQLKPLTFKTWFEPIIPTSLEGGLLTVEVPSTYFYEWLEEHYFDLIQAALFDVLGQDAKLQYAVKVPRDDGAYYTLEHNPYPVGGDGQPEKTNGGMRSYVQQPQLKREEPFITNLNPKFTFESFIRGDGNQFARAAALNVANNAGETAFNPLVLYGGVGLGKTHLIQAIGNYVSMNNPRKRVYYVSSEKFTIDFVEAIEKNNTIDFSNFYRSMDVLIVDDIQFFSGKERTQDTFFHTFNTLHQLKKQIILSSDRPPKDLVGLDERLISRFQCGLTVDVQPPDLETRIAILRKKAEGDHIDIPQDVIEFIASNVKSNIRELEGCYIGLIARHTLEQCELDVALAEKVLRNVIDSEKKDITVEQIQKMVADHFKISENSLRAKTRKQEIVLPRQVAMFLSKNLTRASLKTIGLHFGGRDHSTIIHAYKTIEKAMEQDDSLRSHVEHLEKQISYISR
ncbi:MAG: chromosomal replication initiator protein DnaA [Bacteroidota bacterium]|nr:chromosomal replication initiator protein DnaA [Bacteroidota bacterium]